MSPKCHQHCTKKTAEITKTHDFFFCEVLGVLLLFNFYDFLMISGTLGTSLLVFSLRRRASFHFFLTFSFRSVLLNDFYSICTLFWIPKWSKRVKKRESFFHEFKVAKKASGHLRPQRSSTQPGHQKLCIYV